MAINSRLIPADFTPIPSQAAANAVDVHVTEVLDSPLDAVGFAVGPKSPVPSALGLDSDALARVGFTGALGQTLVLPQSSGPVFVAFGVGNPDEQNHASLRDAAASFARATERFAKIGIDLGAAFALDGAVVGQLVTEGVLLSRYRFTELQPSASFVALTTLDIVSSADRFDDVTAGVKIGVVTSRATALARDLANNPPGHLTATRMGEAAHEVGPGHGLTVETFDKEQLIALGCGGLLGVNAGSAEEPRMIKMTYSPAKPTAHIGLVGKGIMYDAGGISLKPSDSMHLLMKMDMAGASAIFGAMTALQDLGCTAKVTAWLMCTDNMPSGDSYKLGDVLVSRNGTTIEVKNTDAEGRLVMSDAFGLANEEGVDAIIDIATLTGAALMAFGVNRAPVYSNDDALAATVLAASASVDEPLWRMPLEKKYRPQLDSEIADISNLGGPYAGATTAALFLEHFAGGTPWAHLDIAGTMQTEKDDAWRTAGATGFGARTLLETAAAFGA